MPSTSPEERPHIGRELPDGVQIGLDGVQSRSIEDRTVRRGAGCDRLMSMLQCDDVLLGLCSSGEPLTQRIAAGARLGPIDQLPDGYAASRRSREDFEVAD